jgi:squalene-hopene/tetraprenyl-beta-curcumene cyclase
VRLFCAVPLALAFETLAMVRAGTDALVPDKTPKVGREAVAAIVRDATNGSHSDLELAALFRRARSEGTDRRRVLETTMRKASAHLLRQQAKEGFWKGELETNVTMDAEDLLLRQFLGIRTDEATQKAANWIRSQMRADGSWANAKGAPIDLSTTVEAYVALKLAGDPIDAPHMKKIAELIRDMGGVPATRVFTRVWLALFGLWDWKDLPILPPEMNLLPSWFPLNVYDFACWARQTVVALSVVMTYRPVRPIGFDLAELGVEPWEDDRRPSLKARAFKTIDRALRVYSKRPYRPLRERALREAERWIVQRQEADGSWGGIQPPWVYSLMALSLRGYPLDHPVMRAGLEGLDRFTIVDGPIRRLEACQSPVWDTCLALQALADAGVPRTDPRMVRGVEWILKNEVRVKGDWSIRRPDLPPGGWAFEFANVNYPDIDDTAEVILGLRAVVHPDPARVESAIARAVRWTLGMQSSDGGWGAFDADNTQGLCRDIPFCDFGEVIDDPSADVTAHVVEMLCREGLGDHPATRAGVEWLLRHQEKDGSWFGRWGVNYVYGTGAVLVALAEAKIDREAKSMRRGVEWLYAHQNSDGGWGEDVRSYDDDAWRGRGESTPSQTAWALLGLVAAGEEDPRIDRAVEYLARVQREDGGFDEDFHTGTGFPGDFFINYHLYRQIFPVMALGRLARRVGVVVEQRRGGGVDVPLYELVKDRESVSAG